MLYIWLMNKVDDIEVGECVASEVGGGVVCVGGWAAQNPSIWRGSVDVVVLRKWRCD